MIRLMVGDWAEQIALLPDANVDMVLTDPPYSNSNHAWDEPVDWPAWWEQIWRVAKPNAAVIVFGQGIHSFRVVEPAQRQYRYTLIWEANTITGQLNANRMPLRSHQDLLVFYRKQPTYNPQMWEGQPSHRANRSGKTDYQRRFYGEVDYHDQEPGLTSRFPRSVVKFDRVHVREAVVPSQKPVPLLRWLIRTYTDPGQVVLDTFAGSGSTLVAAAEEDRDGWGIENQPDRIAIIKERTS